MNGLAMKGKVDTTSRLPHMEEDKHQRIFEERQEGEDKKEEKSRDKSMETYTVRQQSLTFVGTDVIKVCLVKNVDKKEQS